MKRGGNRVVRVIETSVPPGKKLLDACAALGVVVRRVERRAPIEVVVRVAERALAGDMILITGPSGGGKSTLLREVRDELLARGVRCETASGHDDGGCLLDAMGLGAVEGARVLSGAGLGDALLWARRVSELSDGERARFAIARALARLERAPCNAPRVLIADEFASVLDRATARTLCITLRKLIDRSASPIGVVLATGHEDVMAWLCPGMVVVCADGAARVMTGGQSGGSASHCRSRVGTGHGAIPLPRGQTGNARPRARGVGRSRRTRG